MIFVLGSVGVGLILWPLQPVTLSQIQVIQFAVLGGIVFLLFQVIALISEDS